MEVMRSFLLSVFAFLVLCSPASSQGFFVGLPDIPVMPGLTELEDRGLSYDKPEGRILVAVASIDDSISDSDIERFYEQALPQFGWVPKTRFFYERGEEVLEISIHYDGTKKILEVIISP